jgi:hypothetical protein
MAAGKAAEIGLTRERIRATLGHERQVEEGRVSVAEVERRLTESASHFDRREVIRAVAEFLPAGALRPVVEELADAFLGLDSVIGLERCPSRRDGGRRS